ncbi:MAG: DUF2911 domain-containing protein [Chitinophagaceae bacterium]
MYLKYGPLFSLLLSFTLLLTFCTDYKKQVTSVLPTNDSEIVKKGATNPYLPIDLSPADIIYFPVDYPVAKMSGKTAALPFARVIYSRPHKQGRKIFGGLLKYGEPWRLGANEATEIEFFKPVTIQNKKIGAGRYMMYCIPGPEFWTIAFNTNIYSWGLTIDQSKDLFRFKTTVQPSAVPIEYFTMVFEKTGSGADLIMAWDDVVSKLPISF